MDTIQCMRKLLSAYSDCSKSSTILESIQADVDFAKSISEIKDSIIVSKKDIPTYVPILTPSEIFNMEIDADMTDEEKQWLNNYSRTCMIGTSDITSYKNDVLEAYNKWEMNEDEASERRLLHLGWIPSVEPTMEAFKIARDNLYEYAESHMARIIDLSETTNLLSVTEASATPINGLYPVYFVCTYTGTTMGKIITSVTSAKYSHSAIGFAPQLDKLYSYNMNAKFNGGLSFESLEGYMKDSAAAKIYVQCVFVTKKQYDKIKGNVEWYVANWKNSRYSVANLFNIVAGRVEKTNRNLSMVCSQFVDSLFKLVNIDLTNKPSNLVTPANLVEVKNPTVYKLYEGDAKGYDYKKIQSMVNKLAANAQPGRSTVYESAKSMYSDETVLEIYKAIDRMLTAKCLFEDAIPIQIEDNGDLTISTYKNYELKYQEIHTLLKRIDSVETMKDELCKLWWLECKLEKKIQVAKSKKKDKDPVVQDYYKLRSRVLNDFTKYSKKVMKNDPEFNFSEYYKNSSYYDGSVVVKRNTLKGISSFIQSILIK